MGQKDLITGPADTDLALKDGEYIHSTSVKLERNVGTSIGSVARGIGREIRAKMPCAC